MLSVSGAAPVFAEAAVSAAADTSAELKEKWNTIDGKRYFVKNGKIKTGWLTYGDYRYYLDPREKGAAATGYSKIDGKLYYFTSSGKLVTARFGYKIGSKYYHVSAKGVLKRLTTVEGLAGARLDSVKGDIRAAFDWCAHMKYRDIKVPAGKKPAEYLGEYGFKYKQGDCLVQAYAFYWMAKRRGHDAKVVQGYVLQKNGKMGEHAWVELQINGKTYVCDPNLAAEVYVKKGQDPKPAYKFQYGASGTYKYYDRNKKQIKKK